MRLDQELVKRGLCASRQEAQECILLGFVVVDGSVVTKQTKRVDEQSTISVLKKRRFVSRGGDKLEGALLHVYPSIKENYFKEKAALDVGSSTGGFTDCLLYYGISSVVAVDVGTSQLHSQLRNNPKVSLFENMDIRNFTSDTTFDIVVADVSFIALEKIIDTIVSFGAIHSEYFLLIKPQFEVGFGNTKKGIVKDATLVDKVLLKYKEILEAKAYTMITIFPCSIQGGDGNQEYFVYFKK